MQVAADRQLAKQAVKLQTQQDQLRTLRTQVCALGCFAGQLTHLAGVSLCVWGVRSICLDQEAAVVVAR